MHVRSAWRYLFIARPGGFLLRTRHNVEKFVKREIPLSVPCKREMVNAVYALVWRHGWVGFAASG